MIINEKNFVSGDGSGKRLYFGQGASLGYPKEMMKMRGARAKVYRDGRDIVNGSWYVELRVRTVFFKK